MLWTTAFPSGRKTTRPVLPRRSLTTWCGLRIKAAHAASQQRSGRRMHNCARPDSDGSSSILKQTHDADRRWRRTERVSVRRSQRWPVRLPLECRCSRKHGVTERPSKPDRCKQSCSIQMHLGLKNTTALAHLMQNVSCNLMHFCTFRYWNACSTACSVLLH